MSVVSAFNIYQNTDNKNFFAVCATMYGILLLTIIRYDQYTPKVQRLCSGCIVVVLTIYIFFWIYTYKVYKDFHDRNIHSCDYDFTAIAICSGITGLTDSLIFISYCCEKETKDNSIVESEIPLIHIQN